MLEEYYGGDDGDAQDKHRERMAVRSKQMTLHTKENKYIKYFDNIRTIQSMMLNTSDSCQIPSINNTNVDRSIAIIHTTILECFNELARENVYVHHSDGA